MDELKRNDNEIRRRVIETIIDFFDDVRNKDYSRGDLENRVGEIFDSNITFANMCRDCVLADRNIRREREVPQDRLIEQAQLLQSTGELHRRLMDFEKGVRTDLGLLCGVVHKMATYDMSSNQASPKVDREELDFLKRKHETVTERVASHHGDKCRCDACKTDEMYSDVEAGELRTGPPCPTCKKLMGKGRNIISNGGELPLEYGSYMCDRCASTFIVCPRCSWFLIETLESSVWVHSCKRCGYRNSSIRK